MPLTLPFWGESLIDTGLIEPSRTSLEVLGASEFGAVVASERNSRYRGPQFHRSPILNEKMLVEHVAKVKTLGLGVLLLMMLGSDGNYRWGKQTVKL